LHREIAARWLGLAIVAVVAFATQENLELALAGGDPPGIAVLAHHGGLAVPVLLGVSLVVALVEGLVRWRRAILLWRIGSAPGRGHRAAVAARPPIVRVRRPQRAAGRPNAVRGPPRLAAQPA
jgi:hypothetical protein